VFEYVGIEPYGVPPVHNINPGRLRQAERIEELSIEE